MNTEDTDARVRELELEMRVQRAAARPWTEAVKDPGFADHMGAMLGDRQAQARYARSHLEKLRRAVGLLAAEAGRPAELRDAAALQRYANASAFHSRCLSRADGGPDHTADEFAEGERLIDESAGIIARLGVKVQTRGVPLMLD
jgi:hypothetical protein